MNVWQALIQGGHPGARGTGREKSSLIRINRDEKPWAAAPEPDATSPEAETRASSRIAAFDALLRPEFDDVLEGLIGDQLALHIRPRPRDNNPSSLVVGTLGEGEE